MSWETLTHAPVVFAERQALGKLLLYSGSWIHPEPKKMLRNAGDDACRVQGKTQGLLFYSCEGPTEGCAQKLGARPSPCWCR